MPVCFQNWEYTSTDFENQLDLPKLKVQFYCYIKQVLLNDFFFYTESVYRYHRRTTSRCGVKLAMLQEVTYERGANS